MARNSAWPRNRGPVTGGRNRARRRPSTGVTMSTKIINDEDLVAFPDGAFPKFAFAYAALQSELEVSVFTGTDTVVVSWGDLVTTLAGGIEPPAPQPLDPIEVPLYSGVINEIYFSTLIPGWTTAHGGSLVLRAVFEEEGTELQGTLLAFGVDIDLSHLEIDVFLLPRLDSHQTV